MPRFKSVYWKITYKTTNILSKISTTDISKIKEFKDLMMFIRVEPHGFQRCFRLLITPKRSCLQFLKNITIHRSSLTVKNDSFLGKKCYPYQEAAENDHINF